ncbi:hypothetical protein CEXT_797681 [Caerostris extrusa]|uniref:Uncharacterized protein n=1 Tax=Caerostris extrusa TaxID=172846 RepID=A0AAV4MCR9_CAEEX|nr:hypothetical protein CEXT_797681 [Caerostris extrusa]
MVPKARVAKGEEENKMIAIIFPCCISKHLDWFALSLSNNCTRVGSTIKIDPFLKQNRSLGSLEAIWNIQGLSARTAAAILVFSVFLWLATTKRNHPSLSPVHPFPRSCERRDLLFSSAPRILVEVACSTLSVTVTIVCVTASAPRRIDAAFHGSGDSRLQTISIPVASNVRNRNKISIFTVIARL